MTDALSEYRIGAVPVRRCHQCSVTQYVYVSYVAPAHCVACSRPFDLSPLANGQARVWSRPATERQAPPSVGGRHPR